MTSLVRTALADLAAPRGGSVLGRLLARVALRRQRRRLADLDDAILRDIGITRAEAAAEARRPFWDAPPHWDRFRRF